MNKNILELEKLRLEILNNRLIILSQQLAMINLVKEIKDSKVKNPYKIMNMFEETLYKTTNKTEEELVSEIEEITKKINALENNVSDSNKVITFIKKK